MIFVFFFFFQAEDGIRDVAVTGVQTCALPISPESDEEGQGKMETGKTEASKTDTAKAETAKTDGQEREKPKPPEPVKVDFEKIGQRILALPIPARNYLEIIPGKEGVLFLLEGPLVDPLNGPSTLTASRFDLKSRNTDKLLENIRSLHVSSNGEKLLYRQAGGPPPAGNTPPPQTWVSPPVPPAPSSSLRRRRMFPARRAPARDED